MSPSDPSASSEKLITAEEAQKILDICDLAARIVREGGTTAVHAEVARRASGEACYAVCENRFATPRRSELLSWSRARAHLRRIPPEKRESVGGMWIARVLKRAARKEAA